MRMSMYRFGIFALVVFTFASCGLTNPKNKGKGVNLFSIQQDKELGKQVASEIDANTAEYPLLDPVQYKFAYDYVNKVRDKILSSGQVDYKDEFEWKIKIIHDDSTLNAFCTPGGYIYVYTGILKFLDSEDQFAGVMGHEIAHADMRHSTRQMTQMFGVQVLLSVIAGNRAAIQQITGALIGLKFSRNHETEADGRSVKYLCPTDYNAAGGAGFFQKIQEMGGSGQPEFLSTHPDPGNRIEHFHNDKATNGCVGSQTFQSEYKAMVAKLPK
jgi:predicted Zn-dependent protease